MCRLYILPYVKVVGFESMLSKYGEKLTRLLLLFHLKELLLNLKVNIIIE